MLENQVGGTVRRKKGGRGDKIGRDTDSTSTWMHLLTSPSMDEETKETLCRTAAYDSSASCSRRLICHVQQLLFAECRQLLDYMMKTQAYFSARCQVLFGLTIICNISLKDREAEGGRKSIVVRTFRTK